MTVTPCSPSFAKGLWTEAPPAPASGWSKSHYDHPNHPSKLQEFPRGRAPARAAHCARRRERVRQEQRARRASLPARHRYRYRYELLVSGDPRRQVRRWWGARVAGHSRGAKEAAFAGSPTFEITVDFTIDGAAYRYQVETFPGNSWLQARPVTESLTRDGHSLLVSSNWGLAYHYRPGAAPFPGSGIRTQANWSRILPRRTHRWSVRATSCPRTAR